METCKGRLKEEGGVRPCQAFLERCVRKLEPQRNGKSRPQWGAILHPFDRQKPVSLAEPSVRETTSNRILHVVLWHTYWCITLWTRWVWRRNHMSLAQGVHTSVIFKNRGYQSGSANHRNKQTLQSWLLLLPPREPVAKHLLRTLLDTTHKAKGLQGPSTIFKSVKRFSSQKVWRLLP